MTFISLITLHPVRPEAYIGSICSAHCYYEASVNCYQPRVQSTHVHLCVCAFVCVCVYICTITKKLMVQPT